MRIFHRRDSGQAVIVAALIFLLLLGLAGVALDGANAFSQRRRVSNAADAASLAGARMLIAVKNDGGKGDEVNDAVEEFLISANGIDPATTTWQASYVSRAAPDTIIEVVDDTKAPPTNASGVRVDLTFSFDTTFLRVIGESTMTVGASSTSVFGALATATGEDLVPVGITDTAMAKLRDMDTMRLDLKGKIMDEYNRLPPARQAEQNIDDVITTGDLAHVSFSGADNTLSNPNGCKNPHGDDNNLSYWWCNGTEHVISSGHVLPPVDPNWGEPNSSIIDRVDDRPIGLVPVYSQVPDGSGGVAYQVLYFVAVQMSYDPSDKALEVTVIRDYVAAGAIADASSDIEASAWAVNLKR